MKRVDIVKGVSEEKVHNDTVECDCANPISNSAIAGLCNDDVLGLPFDLSNVRRDSSKAPRQRQGSKENYSNDYMNKWLATHKPDQVKKYQLGPRKNVKKIPRRDNEQPFTFPLDHN